MSTFESERNDRTGTDPRPETIDHDDLTLFQYRILFLVAEEARYGLAIKEALETEVYQTDVNHGRLYPNLDQLVERGLIDKSALDRRTNEYAITDRGRAVLREHLDWERAKFDGGER